jgi:hypothetical protein
MIDSARHLRPLLLAAAFALPVASGSAQSADPRVGLKAGWLDAGQAARNMTLTGHADRSAGFVDPANPGDFSLINSDLAFSGNLVFQGGYHGFQVWDVSNPAQPTLRTSFTCPGGQGDLSILGNLLFMSVEENSGRVDCGTQGVKDTVSAERFRGVRIFDISDLDHPKQVAAVQTCRGSHTHTLVPDPKDKTHVYVYVSGTGPVRSPNELAGCSLGGEDDPNSSLFRIEVIHVLLAHPEQAKVIATPRIFADSGHIAGLWKGGTHGEGTQNTAQTNMCHDITVYSAYGLAAGACSGNGLLLDISKPGDPKRVAEVMDPNFAYWHSATFNNDASKILYTDEWGGGVAPRCRSTDRATWGADAIFTRKGHALTLAGYYKLPAWQTATENCVAHNGNLVPVPGRDIMVQAWYQGGVSVVDFTDPAHPVEIAFFDRGPVDSAKAVLAGQWSTYWHNGRIYGSEIARGLDVLELTPSDLLSENELAAAKLVRFDEFNPQSQQKITWPASFVVARAYLDQLARGKGLGEARVSAARASIDAAEKLSGAGRRSALNKLAASLERDARSAKDGAKVRALAAVVRKIGA